MSKLALIDADCTAEGHPSDCTEPAPGTVEGSPTYNITVTVGAQTGSVASVAEADLVFPSHSHDYSVEQGCHDDASHTIDGSGSTSLTINGSPVYVLDDAVASDPKTNGDVDIVQNPFSTSVQEL